MEYDIFEEEADKVYCDISNIGVFNKSKRKIFYKSSFEINCSCDEADKLVLSIDIERPCESCGSINVTKTFSKSPLWLIIQNLISIYQKRKLTVYDHPTEITINGTKCSSLICTYLIGYHFRSIIFINAASK